MKPFIQVVTLAVEDLERSLAFYRDGMGLQTEGIFGTEFEHGAVVFFHLRTGLILALWPKASLAAEANIPLSEIHAGGVTLGHNVRSREEVDEVMAQAKRAGATITDPARPLLRWLLRLLPRLGRPHLGNYLESRLGARRVGVD